MPQHKSAIKRVKTSAKRNLANRKARSEIRTFTKRMESASTTEEGQAVIRDLLSSLDRAGKKNLMHKNQVARRKSRAQRLFNKLSS